MDYSKKYHVQHVSLERGYVIPDEIVNLIDEEFDSDEYLMNGISYYRIHYIDDNRILAIDDYKVYKINFKNAFAQKKFHHISQFFDKMIEDKDYLKKIF